MIDIQRYVKFESDSFRSMKFATIDFFHHSTNVHPNTIDTHGHILNIIAPLNLNLSWSGMARDGATDPWSPSENL